MQKTMSWFKLGFLCVMALIAFLVLQGRIVSKTAEYKDLETSLRVELSQVREAQSDVQAEIDDVGSEAYVERHARTDYQFIKPGELRFGFTNEEALSTYTAEEKAILAEEMKP